MPLIDITKPNNAKFLIESYEKTERLRLKWNSLYGEKVKKASNLQHEEKGYFEKDVLKAEMVAGLPTVTRDFISGSRNRLQALNHAEMESSPVELRKGHSVIDVGLGDSKDDPRLARPDTDLGVDQIMRPVDPEENAIIYKGPPNFGRKAYLKSRNKISPEDKFYFTQSTSQEHGWRFKDSYFGKNKPKYARTGLFASDVASRTGPQPDPPHYNSPDAPLIAKCLL